ncbi:MAG: hypothetical protein JXB29_02715 [Sedimentisphaerales bacterium]|nr:hypothetical protein [Sedimentisphaerales bacterium]
MYMPKHLHIRSFLQRCVIAGCIAVVAGGCNNAGSRSSLLEELDKTRLEKTELEHQVKKCKARTGQMKKQFQVLSQLNRPIRLDGLYDLQAVRIHRYTNLYDKDKDGKKESLIVYIQPIDEQGDIVKAGGAVDVELWDLSRKAEQAMLGQWHIKPDELKKLWFATLITINYRLTFDIGEIIEETNEPLTVKVTFTDYLSGKVFKEQKIIKPSNP